MEANSIYIICTKYYKTFSLVVEIILKGLMRCEFYIKNFFTQISPNKYFQSPPLNKLQSIKELLYNYSVVRLGLPTYSSK